MNREEYFEFHENFTKKMAEITRQKNNDYAGREGSGSTFKNFELVDKFGFATTEQGFLTRMVDKLSRLSTFVQEGQLEVKDESVQDTLMDLANYSILFAGYLESKKPKSGSLYPEADLNKGMTFASLGEGASLS